MNGIAISIAPLWPLQQRRSMPAWVVRVRSSWWGATRCMVLLMRTTRIPRRADSPRPAAWQRVQRHGLQGSGGVSIVKGDCCIDDWHQHRLWRFPNIDMLTEGSSGMHVSSRSGANRMRLQVGSCFHHISKHADQALASCVSMCHALCDGLQFKSQNWGKELNQLAGQGGRRGCHHASISLLKDLLNCCLDFTPDWSD